ncbi:MAG: histidinol-phosphate transaminase [Anaerolineae bacterium]
MAIRHLVLNPDLLKVPAYTRGKSLEDIKRELGVEEVIKLGSNENPLGPSPQAIQAVKQAAADMHRYPSVDEDDLKCKLATLLGPQVEARNIIVGNGSADVMRSVAQSFLSPGGEVIIGRPAFQMYELATHMYGGRCVFVEGENYTYNLQAMADKITERTRLIFITNPNNPTGLIVSQRDIDDFMARVPPSVVVVFDEAYHEYVDDDQYPDTLRYVVEGRNVVITRTFSKIYGLAGMRVGYGIAPQELIDYLLHAQIPFQNGKLALCAAAASLDDHEHVRRSQEINAQGREYLYRNFEEMGLSYLPSQANFILLYNLKQDVEEINQALLRQGVIVRPTAPFGLPQALRVTIGTPQENERFVEALKLVLQRPRTG